MSTFSHLDVVSLPVSRQFEKVVLSNEVCVMDFLTGFVRYLSNQ